MTYEQFKALQEAGYPFRVMDNPLGKFGPEYAVLAPHTIEEFSNYYEPTLEELIEKCGEGLWSLTKHGTIWQTNWVDGMAGETAGSTPKEAVIALYIALSKK